MTWTQRLGRLASGCAIAVVSFTAVSLSTSTDRVAEATGALPTISGRVFIDQSLDGAFQTGEIGFRGVTVSAYNVDGATVGATTTGNNGLYTLTLDSANTGTVRVEFDTPVGYDTTLVAGATMSALSSIRFVDPGATNVDYGVIDPATICVTQLVHVCFREGPLTSSPNSRVLGISPFSTPTTRNPPEAVGDPGNDTFGQTIPNDVPGLISTVATKVTVGATWGVAVDRDTGLLWNSAVIRRHLALGSEGIGGVYVVDRNGTLVTSFDLEALGLDLRPSAADLGIAAAFETAGEVVFSDANRDILGVTAGDVIGVTGTTYGPRNLPALSRDIPGFAGVGKAGLGDIDISKDSQYLWVTNLNTRTIHRYTIGGTAQAPTLGGLQTWTVADGHTCAGGTGPLRPWGLDPQPDGTVVVGAVCTNESAVPSSTTGPGLGVVLRLNSALAGAQAWTQLATVDFGYQHVYDFCTNHVRMTCSWKSWTDSWTSISTLGSHNASQHWWTQPVIADVATLPDGSFALGINDRFSYMASASNYAPLDVRAPAFITAYTAGGLRLLCKTDTGWQQEANGDCAGLTAYDSSRTSSFFRNDFQNAHPATSMGGLTYANGRLAYAAMDAASYFTSGVRWVSTVNGDQVNALTITGEFGKASGVGDIEAFCDSAPLQIGNRVWYDNDADGIQDPDERPVIDVQVTLYNVSTSTVVGTASTNDAGEYYFTSTNTEPAAGEDATPDAFGGGLAPGTPYQVRLEDPADCAMGEPLDRWSLTLQDGTTSAGPPSRDDLIDSDAATTGATACLYDVATVVVAPMQRGEVNHSYDIGFHVPSVYLGDLVWLDANGNGTLDADERGVAGVILSITKADGTAVTDVLGAPVTTTSTSATGHYRFPLLPLGSYRVTVTVPDGYSLANGSTQTSTSIDLQNSGTGDRLVDFGLVAAPAQGANPNQPPAAGVELPAGTGVLITEPATPPPTLRVSVGDYVWWDTNEDGRQDATDQPLEGVRLSITKVDGTTVRDVSGRVVGPALTDAQGRYSFDDLPPGRYVVRVQTPAGFEPTGAGEGDTRGDSSTDTATSRALSADGDHDPTLDFGFVGRGVSVGDYVWFDANRNGLQDVGEQPIVGAVLTVTDMNGQPVRDLAGRSVGPQTTGSDGRFLFANLPPGQYRVVITYPQGFGPTRPVEGPSRSGDSSTIVAVTRPLAAGDADRSLDFGVVPVVSVGDYVWWDTNGDGRQDATDVPLEGVTLTITTADGQPVLDTQGLPVAATRTDAKGWYTFDHLPFGQYTVCVTDPFGYRPTRADLGSLDGNSSTGCATSRDLQVDGDRDPTLDFGYVPLSMRLPATGGDHDTALGLAGLLLAAGVAAWWAAHRRRRLGSV